MADFAYTIGIDVDSGGIDAFIAKVRSLANSANFGSSFNVPKGVNVAGPGFAGGQGTLATGEQAVGFSTAVQAQALARLTQARQAGQITSTEFEKGRRHVTAITEALAVGARRFEAVLGKTAGQTASGLIVPESALREQAAREAKTLVGVKLRDFDRDEGNSERGSIDKSILSARKDELDALHKRLHSLRTQTGVDEQISRAKAEILVAERQQARAERQQAQAVFQQAREEGFFNVGTRTQRFQAALHSRNGGIADPLGERTAGQLFTQRAFQASSFAVGGLAFYGALQVLRDTLKETEALEREFAVVEGQLDRTFGSGAEEALGRFKESVREISLATGQLGSEVALVQRQLTAAFVPTQAGPGESEEAFRARQRAQEDLAQRNTELAFKFAEVTGLDSKEITDSLTAIGLSFDELDGNFQPVLDRAISLEEEFGVLGGQIVTFTADLAPLAANLGFSATQLEELGAAAQKFSGRSGGQLAEQFGRIFTDLPTKSADLVKLFTQGPQSIAELAPQLADAFVADNMEQVLEIILQAANRIQTEGLDPGLTQQISEVVAGRREGASFASILREPQQLLAALQDTTDGSAGAVEERWERVRESLSETMERLRRSVEQLAEAILSAGLVDALTAVASLFTVVATAAEKVIRVFDFFNDATGGMIGQLASLYAILKTVDLVMKSLGESAVFGAVFPGLAARFSGVAAAGGSFAGLKTGASSLRGLLTGGGAGALAGRIGPGLSSLATGLGARASAAAAGGSVLTFPSAVGATAAGFAAPAAALITVNEARLAMGQLRDQVESQGKAYRLAADSASTFDLVMRDASTNTKLFATNVMGHEISGIPGTGGVGRFFLGGDLPEDIVPEVLSNRAGPGGLSAALAALRGSGIEIDENDFGEAAIEVENALLGEEADLDSVAEYLRDVAEDNPAIGEALASAIDKALSLQTAAEAVASGQSTANLEQLVKALGENRATPDSVRTALDQALAPLQELLRAAQDAGDYAAIIANTEAIAAIKQQAEAAISAYYANSVSFAERIRGIFGDSTPKTQAATARRILADTRITDPETRLQALEDLQAARDALFADQLAAAESDAERIALLERGPGTDPIAQAEAIYIQAHEAVQTRLTELRDATAKQNAFNSTGQQGPVADGGDRSNQIEQLEGLTREAILEISDQLIEDIEKFGEGAIDIRLVMLKARRAELYAAVRAISYGGYVGAGGQAMLDEIQAIGEQIETYEALQESGLDPSQIVLDDGGPNDDQKREADDLRAQHAQELRAAQWELAAARAAGDPVAEADVAVARARDELSNAEGDVETIRAQAQLVTALKQQKEAYDDIGRAQLELLAARNEEDPKKSAEIALKQADIAVKQAKGTAERLRAQAQRIRAERALRDAIRDIADSQVELAIAMAESAGNVIQAAELRLKQALTDLSRVKRAGDDSGINRARAEVVNAQRALNDTILNKQQGDIDFALQMGTITTRQAIESYQQLLTIPTNTEEQNRELQLIIKRLQGELQQDFQYNLPTSLGLPTLYEVRRAGQDTTGGYNDNRVITVTVNANTSASAADIAATVASVVGDPTRNGSVPRRYY